MREIPPPSGDIQAKVTAFYTTTLPERCGVILDDGQVIELTNIATTKDTEHIFVIDPVELIALEDGIVGTWHTHPDQSGNLGLSDYHTFLTFSEWYHVIAGNDGLWVYQADGSTLLQVMPCE